MGKSLSKEHRDKISAALTGRKISQETKEKLSNIARKQWASPALREVASNRNKARGVRPPSRLGAVLSEETRAKMRNSANKGPDHYNWKGGKENALMHARAKRARLRNAGGSFMLGEWENLKAQYNWTCPGCGAVEPDISLAADHIIPLVKGGSNNIENIQPLCTPCNSRKYTSIIKYSPWEGK